ncbi:uncharacterized protein N7529_006938 [Penicillium soppii]|uniref:uncharacterized protein n=1 Tax=Penicillium soppii TaxID=69789 RepID=UPI0025467720|nr:uncharacterized protein N7529_006938 [Penicillium soppii]KAJ5865022.1 hypothetical protein N7529_006938 [Penicillium soppii]
MSNLSRAFTRRNKRPEVSAPMPYRGEGHTRLNSGSIKRSNISGPLQLLSTTNMLAYNAPDIRSASSSASSLRSDDAFSPQSYASSMSSPDVSPYESSPVEANPLTSYFPKRSATVTSHPRSSTSSTDAPVIPQRALSHTKRSHQELARNRSVSRMSPPPLHAPRSTPTIRASEQFFQPEQPFVQPEHPFSKELAQVNEVAEEFGGLNMLDEEERILHEKGLLKFSAKDYLVEVEELYSSIFDDDTRGSLYTSWF